MRIMFEMVSEALRRKRDLWASARDTWYNKAKLEEEIYYNDKEGTGTNFTAAQLAKIDKGSGVPVTINHVYPKVNQKIAILTQVKPAFRVVGLDERGKKYSHTLDKAAKSVMYRSEAVGEEEETIKNMMVLGLGHSAIMETDYYQFGEFDIKFEDIHPSMVILDSNSRKRSGSDMQGFFIEKEITLSEAEQKYGPIIDEINRLGLQDLPVTMKQFATSMSSNARGLGVIDDDGFDTKVMVQEYYDRVYTTMYFMEDPKTGDIFRQFEENLNKDSDIAALAGALSKEQNMFTRKTISLGSYTVAQEMKPIRALPIKTKYLEWGGRPYRSYGMVHFVKDMQDTFDKIIQTMIVNGMLTNNAGYIYPQGGIAPKDLPNWETIGSKPGVMKPYVLLQDASGKVVKPEREQIQQLSNFFPMVLELMRTGIEVSTGVNAVVSGDAQEANVEVFSSLQQYQNSAMQRIQMAMSHINLANEQLGNVVIDYLVANINTDQTYMFFNDTDDLEEIKVIKEHAKDFNLGRYSVLSIAAEAMPTQKQAQATELFKIAQTTPDPNEKNIYIKKAFGLSDIRGFDEMQDELDQVKQLQGQVEQMQEGMDRIEEINKQLQNRVINAELEQEVVEAQSGATVKIKVAEQKAIDEIEIDKLQIQLREARKPKVETKNKT